MNKRVAVFTLGCKVNLYDSDSMLEVFRRAGFEVFEGLAEADIYVINTCAVTAEAEKKSRQAVARIKKINPNADIFVCGCASQNNASQFEKDGVKYIIGTDKKVDFARKIANEYKASGSFDLECNYQPVSKPGIVGCFDISNAFEENEGVVNLRTRHFIKVQDGCNNFCSYCLVPYLRGRCRSRSVESIKSELDSVQNSVKEVVISGVNMSAYGEDIGLSLADLLDALKDYKMRIRLGSLEVNVVDERFLQSAKALYSFCDHFHLSLQSGSDATLKKMNRKYTSSEYMSAVELIRKHFPNAAITTDVIVGFPTETDENFLESYDFVRKVGFSDVHVFPYSPRKGTVAANFKKIDDKLMAERVKKMTELKGELINSYLKKQIGRELEALFETYEDGYWVGHTKNYVKAYSKDAARNELKKVVPTELFKDGLK